MKYIAVCLSRCEGSSDNFRVKLDGKDTFCTEEEVNEAIRKDMAEYLDAEIAAGRKAKIVGNHIEWEDPYYSDEYEAKWYTYTV